MPLRATPKALLALATCAVSLSACSSNAPPRVKDPLLTVQDRTVAPGQRVQAAREALARAGDDRVALRTVWRELSTVAWSTTEDDDVRAGAFAALQSVQDPEAKLILREGLVQGLGEATSPQLLSASAKLAAAEGWTDALPSIVLALAQPHLFAADGYRDRGPRAVPTATLRFGSQADDVAMQRNERAGTVLPPSTPAQASADLLDAAAMLLAKQSTGVEAIFALVTQSPSSAPQPPKLPNTAPAAKPLANKPQPPAKPGEELQKEAQAAADALAFVKSSNAALAEARRIQRLRLAAYNVLARNPEPAGTWPGVNLHALVQASDAQLPVVRHLRAAHDALGTYPTSGEALRQLLSQPLEGESAQQWWASLAAARSNTLANESLSVGFAPIAQFAHSALPSNDLAPRIASLQALSKSAPTRTAKSTAPELAPMPREVALAAAALQASLQSPALKQSLFDQIQLDRSDRRAVYGGWLTLSAANQVNAQLAPPRPSKRMGDFGFTPTDAMLSQSSQALAWYRLSARRENAEDQSTPEPRDFWIAKCSLRPLLIISQAGKQRLSAVMVWENGSVDLGTFDVATAKAN